MRLYTLLIKLMVCLSPHLAAVFFIFSGGGCATAASEWSLPFHAEGGSLVLLGTSAFLSGADVLLLLLLLGTGGQLVTGADLLRLGGSTSIQTTYSVFGFKISTQWVYSNWSSSTSS